METQFSPRVVVYAGNLAHGGGVQVAASWINYMASRLEDPPADSAPWERFARYEISEAVAANLDDASHRMLRPTIVRSKWSRLLALKHYDLEFAIFGPYYGPQRSRIRISGFADVTSVYQPVWPLDVMGRLRLAVRRWASLRFFSGIDLILVETEAIAKRLGESLKSKSGRIAIVPNALNQQFAEYPIDHALVEGIRQRIGDREGVCYVARGYKHKNIDFLGDLGRALEERFGRPVTFMLTLTEPEFESLSRTTQNYSLNLGVLPVRALPSVYRSAEWSIFPSLLEAFSVTPLEALATSTPLFASDRDFVRTIVGDSAIYFDPRDATSAAGVIDSALRNPEMLRAKTERGVELVRRRPSASTRGREYVELITAELMTHNLTKGKV